jgi:SAM-dependent methyltransferase
MLSYTIDDLNELRQTEMDLLLQRYAPIFSGAFLLEVGSGIGCQLSVLSQMASLAVGVDVLATTYSYQPKQTGTFLYYDGVNLPFADNSFDVVYSSNTMEHVLNERGLHRELKRVLRPSGAAIHIVPSSTWRLWTMASHYIMLPTLMTRFVHRRIKQRGHFDDGSAGPQTARGVGQLMLDLLCPVRHGERGNRFTEWWHFRGASWKRRFENLGWEVESIEGLGLFNTGYLVASRLISMDRRKRLARLLGSSCLIFILRPKTISPS